MPVSDDGRFHLGPLLAWPLGRVGTDASSVQGEHSSPHMLDLRKLPSGRAHEIWRNHLPRLELRSRRILDVFTGLSAARDISLA